MPKTKTTQKTKTDQPPWGAPLVWSLTAKELTEVVNRLAEPVHQSLFYFPGLDEEATALDAVNPRNGCSCHWREGTFSDDTEGPLGERPFWTRYEVHVEIKEEFVLFKWEHDAAAGSAEREWHRKDSERVFRLVSGMIGVPVQHKDVVDDRQSRWVRR